MNEIVNELLDISFWVKAILPPIVLAASLWVFSKVLKSISSLKNNLNRKSKLKTLRKIRSIRANHLRVISEIIKNYAYFVSFLILASIYIYGILLNTDLYNDENKKFTMSLLLFSPPIFIFEYIWLRQSQFVKELLKRTDIKHTTSKSTQTTGLALQ